MFQECMDSTFSWYLGLASFPLLLSSQDDEEEDDEGVDGCMKQTAKEKEEQKSDFDVTQQDVVKVNKPLLLLFLLLHLSPDGWLLLCFRAY